MKLTRFDRVIDQGAVWFPAISALLAIVSGIFALRNSNDVAAITGIVSGVLGAGGVYLTGKSSKIRDMRLNEAYEMAEFVALAPTHHPKI